MFENMYFFKLFKDNEIVVISNHVNIWFVIKYKTDKKYVYHL